MEKSSKKLLIKLSIIQIVNDELKIFTSLNNLVIAHLLLPFCKFYR